MAVGPAAGGVLALVGYGWLFVVDAATSWAAVALLLAGMRGERRLEAEARKKPAPVEASRSPATDGPFLFLLLLVFLLATVLFQLFSTLPLYLREVYQLREDRIGLLLALNTAAIVLVEMVLVRFAEGFSPTRVTALGAFLLCGGFALMPLGSSFAWAAVTVLVWTAGEMLVLPFTNALVAQRSGPGQLGRYMGLYALAFSLSAAVGPVAGTAVWEHWGPTVLWTGAGAVGLLLAGGFSALGPAFREREAASEGG
jgi:predicted MFS family arabinose efflux permease